MPIPNSPELGSYVKISQDKEIEKMRWQLIVIWKENILELFLEMKCTLR